MRARHLHRHIHTSQGEGGTLCRGLCRPQWCLLAFTMLSCMALVSLRRVAQHNASLKIGPPSTSSIMERAVSSVSGGGLKGYRRHSPMEPGQDGAGIPPPSAGSSTTAGTVPSAKRELEPDVIQTYLDQISLLTRQRRVAQDLATSLNEDLKHAKEEVRKLATKKEELEKKVQDPRVDHETERLEKKVESLTRELNDLKGKGATVKDGPTSTPVAIPLSTLPSFTTDHRFYVMGGVLTRDEWEGALLVDTLFLGKKLYVGGGEHGVQSLGDQWQMGKIASTRDLAEVAGESRFSCRIGGIGVIEGTLIPTATTMDVNVNSIIDILRCKLPSDVAHRDLTVEIIEEKRLDQGSTVTSYGPPLPLISYVLPWRERTTGYIAFRPESSKQDPWREAKDDIHMCVPGLRSRFVCPWVEAVLEFIEYHSQMGVAHFYFGVDYDWGSEDMDRFLRVIGQYIDEGKVSVSSLNITGAVVGAEMKKIYHINQCLLYAKSMARFVGIWDIDEFLVPREPPCHVGPNNLVELVETQLQQAQKKEDDMCYLLFTSFAHAGPKPPAPLEHVWSGQIFAETREDTGDDGWQKSILSTRNVYYMGYHLPGACRATIRDWTKTVQTKAPDVVRVQNKTAAMFHFRSKMASSVRFFKSEKMEASEYSLHYFPSVVEGLKRRKVDDMIHKICGIRPVMEPVRRKEVNFSDSTSSSVSVSDQ